MCSSEFRAPLSGFGQSTFTNQSVPILTTSGPVGPLPWHEGRGRDHTNGYMRIKILPSAASISQATEKSSDHESICVLKGVAGSCLEWLLRKAEPWFQQSAWGLGFSVPNGLPQKVDQSDWEK
jgi:hypothetical protein